MGDTCDPETLRVSCNHVGEPGFAANHGSHEPSLDLQSYREEGLTVAKNT